MSDLGVFIPPLPLRIRVMDFHARCESMHTRLEWEERRTLLGASDISFVVNAPLEYLADEDGADSVIFIDQTLRSRDLGRRGYQVAPTLHIASTGFTLWAEQIIRYIRHAAFGGDWPGRDYADFRSFLSCSTSRQLRCELVDIDYSNPLPLQQLPSQGFRTLYLLLINNEWPNLGETSELTEAIEELSPNLEAMVLSTVVLPDEPAKALLFGEIERFPGRV